MSASTSTDSSPVSTLASLTSSLSALEASLSPLLETEWNETLESLGTLERAKMDILASYTVNDLIWVYMKLKGIDPAKQEVSTELDRIQTYYSKVRAIEEPESQRPNIDSAAAKRFIKASLPRSQHLPASSSLPPTAAARLAAEQARAAVAEQEESLKRVGKQGRFRFIEAEGGEKLLPGSGADGEQTHPDVLGEDEDEEMEQGGPDGQGVTEEAEEFLRGMEEEMGR